MKRLIERLGAKRFTALLIGPGLVAIALDSAIAHFAGKGIGHPAQLVPLFYAGMALIVVLNVTLSKLPARWFIRGLRALGATSAAVGAAGTYFHLRPMLEDLADERLSWNALEGAMALAPPLFAPGAFIAVGGLLWVLASPRLELKILLRADEPLRAAEPLRVIEVPRQAATSR